MSCWSCGVQGVEGVSTCPRCGADTTAAPVAPLGPVDAVDGADGADAAQSPTLEPERFKQTASVLLMGPAALGVVAVAAVVLGIAASLLTREALNPYLMASVHSPWSIFGVTFGAPVLWGSPEDTGFFSPFPLGLALAVLLVGIWSRRLERSHPSTTSGALIGAAAIPAFLVALVTMLLAWVGTRQGDPDRFGMTEAPDPTTAFLAAGLWIFAAGLIGRWLVSGSPKLPAALLSVTARATVRGAVRSALTHATLSAVVGSALLAIVLWLDRTESFPSDLVTWVWSLPIGGIVLMEYFTGVPLLRSTSGEVISSSQSIEVDGVWSSGPAAVAFVLIPLAALLVVGLRHGAMRARPGRLDGLDCLVTGAMFVAVYVPINAYAQVDAAAPIGHLPIPISGLAVNQLPAALVMFVVGALVPVVGAFVAPRLGRLTASVAKRYAAPPVPIPALIPAVPPSNPSNPSNPSSSATSRPNPHPADSPWLSPGDGDPSTPT